MHLPLLLSTGDSKSVLISLRCPRCTFFFLWAQVTPNQYSSVYIVQGAPFSSFKHRWLQISTHQFTLSRMHLFLSLSTGDSKSVLLNLHCPRCTFFFLWAQVTPNQYSSIYIVQGAPFSFSEHRWLQISTPQFTLSKVHLFLSLSTGDSKSVLLNLHSPRCTFPSEHRWLEICTTWFIFVRGAPFLLLVRIKHKWLKISTTQSVAQRCTIYFIRAQATENQRNSVYVVQGAPFPLSVRVQVTQSQ